MWPTKGGAGTRSEGASWVGEAVLSNTDHVFQNMGDGTYIHSGILSVRHAVAAKTKIDPNIGPIQGVHPKANAIPIKIGL